MSVDAQQRFEAALRARDLENESKRAAVEEMIADLETLGRIRAWIRTLGGGKRSPVASPGDGLKDLKDLFKGGS